MKRVYFVVLIILLCLSPFLKVESTVGNSNAAQYQPGFFPFDSGEKAEYQASWNGIPVASAKIQTSPVWMEGKKFYQVKIRAKSWKVLDLFWKMRASIEATFDATTFLPNRYVLFQRENRSWTEVRASFDRETKKWSIQRQKGKTIKQYEITSPDTFDPVTAFYLLRSLDFKTGDHRELTILGDYNLFRLTLQVVGQEGIETKLGHFNAYRIDAQLFKQDDAITDGTPEHGEVRQATIWISSDKNRLFLRASSKVWIGSVYLELLDAQVQPKT